MLSQFVRTAARQDSHDRAAHIQAIARGEFCATQCGAHLVHKRMPDPIYGHAGFAVKRLLERENTESARKAPAHQLDPAAAPCPELRTYEIDVADVLAP